MPTRSLFVLLALALGLSQPAHAQESHGFLGVSLEEVQGPDGSLRPAVDAVHPGTPAQTAGLAPGDIFLSFAGTELHSARELIETCMATSPGTTVELRLVRAGKELRLKVMLGIRPDIAELQRSTLLDQAAPPWSGARMDGEGMLGSAPLAGKVVVLDFWAYWCGPCKASIPGLNDLAAGLEGQDFALVGVTRESLEDSREVAALQTYPSIHDDTGAVSGAFSVYALPTLVLIDRRGIVRSVHVGMGDLEALGQHVRQLLAEPAP